VIPLFGASDSASLVVLFLSVVLSDPGSLLVSRCLSLQVIPSFAGSDSIVRRKRFHRSAQVIPDQLLGSSYRSSAISDRYSCLPHTLRGIFGSVAVFFLTPGVVSSRNLPHALRGIVVVFLTPGVVSSR